MPNPYSIQIIDDGMDLCRDLCGWLEQTGHAVACGSPNRLTLATLAGNPPALFIVGIASARSDGLTFYLRLGSHRQLRRVPIIVLSDDPDLEYELLDAYDFQPRPFDRERLLAAVARLVEAARKGCSPLLACFAAEQLAPFREMLLERSGLHFSASNQRLLERGLLHRMQALQMTAADKYFAYLNQPRDNQDEFNKLLGLLTVGETCFFRYRAHRDALLHHVLPELLERNAARRRLRIWSAGCSTGEEPYSLAMVLLEHFPQLRDWDAKIFATDINKRALRQAREGIYRSRALRQTDETFRQRYFHQVGEYFAIDPRVRGLVRFAYHNLQDDVFPDMENGTTDLDLILCRNVLIYFQADTVRKIVDRFRDCLGPGGYLFLGHAETLQGISDRFQRLHQHGAFYYQGKSFVPARPAPVTALPPAAPVAFSPPAAPPPAVSPAPVAPASVPLPPASPAPALTPAAEESLYATAMAAFDREDFAVAERLFDQVLASRSEHPLALVGKGLICANRGDHQEARQWCARAIRYDDLCPAAYLLRGLILDMEDQLERALVEYQKVLWLDRDLVMAHYLLAKIHGRLTQAGPQARALRTTIRTLEKQADDNVVPFSGGLSRPVLLEICRRELAAIQSSD